MAIRSASASLRAWRLPWALAEVASNTIRPESGSASSPSMPSVVVASPAARALASPSESGSMPATMVSSSTSLRSSFTIRSVPMLPEPRIAARTRSPIMPPFLRASRHRLLALRTALAELEADAAKPLSLQPDPAARIQRHRLGRAPGHHQVAGLQPLASLGDQPGGGDQRAHRVPEDRRGRADLRGDAVDLQQQPEVGDVDGPQVRPRSDHDRGGRAVVG